MARRGIPEINAGSMADIAFLLLVFFLVTTTMDTPFGIARKLPPPVTEDIDIEIKQRNVFVVLVNANDQLLVEGSLMDISQLKEKAKEFIENPANEEDLPEKTRITAQVCAQKLAEANAAHDNEAIKKWQDFSEAQQLLGDFWDSKQVISLQNDRGTSYSMYIQVQNELAAAYNELRDELSMKVFGKPFGFLYENKDTYSNEVRAVKRVYPMRVSEAEPKAIGG